MFFSAIRKISVVLLGGFLVACGGGGGDGTQESAGSSDTRLLSSGCGYCIYVRSAPADGAAISGLVRLDFYGLNIKSARLLPATGDTPVHGKFNLVQNQDRSFSASMDLDTTKLPNGPLTVRLEISGEQEGRASTITYFTRTWNINNAAIPGQFAVTSVSAPANGAVLSGTRRLEVRGSRLANVELLPATGYTPTLGVFNVSADRTYAWLDLDTKTLADGLRNVRISAFNVMAGQPGAREIIAMPSRQWNFRNNLGGFTASTVVAPAHGSLISGEGIYILVRGTGLENVELLPATGYTPVMGYTTISADKTEAKIYATMSSLPKGVNEFRVSAYNTPPRQPGAQEIVVMPSRTFDVRADGDTGSPAGFSAQLLSAPPVDQFLGETAGGTTRSPTVQFEVSGTNLGNVELVSAKNPAIIYGRFAISPDKTRATLEWNYIIDGKTYDTYQLRILAWDVPPGGSGNQIEVMAPRTYRGIYNPGCQSCGGDAP